MNLLGVWPDLPKWGVEAHKVWAVIEKTVLSVCAEALTSACFANPRQFGPAVS